MACNRATGFVILRVAPLFIGCRSQLRFFTGGSRESHHPLAHSDPSQRNIAVPESAHAKPHSKEVTPAYVEQRRIQRELARQLESQVLWEGTVVSNEQHDMVQHFMRLRSDPRYRNSQEMMVCSGAHVIRELGETGNFPKHLMIREDKTAPSWANPSKTQIIRATHQVMESTYPGTDGFVGDFPIPDPPPFEQLIGGARRYKQVLVLDNIVDGGNLGCFLRTAAGFAFDAVLCVNHCADLYDEEVIRAARGAHFQKVTPFYSLREEDGDDSYAMLNHVLERNHINPLAFSPHASAFFGRTDAAREDKACVSSGAVIASKKLREYCATEYLSTQKAAEEGRKVQGAHGLPFPPGSGCMLLASEDHHQNFFSRLQQKIRLPITALMVDGTATALTVALPVLLYQLRHTAPQDFLSASEEEPTMDLQTSTGHVDIGADRYDISPESINKDDEDLAREAHAVHMEKIANRQAKRMLSDEEHWTAVEEEKIRRMKKRERQRLRVPPTDETERTRMDADPKLPDAIPHFIREGQEIVNRDSLKETAQWASTYRRAPSYDQKMGKFKK